MHSRARLHYRFASFPIYPANRRELLHLPFDLLLRAPLARKIIVARHDGDTTLLPLFAIGLANFQGDA